MKSTPVSLLLWKRNKCCQLTNIGTTAKWIKVRMTRSIHHNITLFLGTLNPKNKEKVWFSKSSSYTQNQKYIFHLLRVMMKFWQIHSEKCTRSTYWETECQKASQIQIFLTFIISSLFLQKNMQICFGFFCIIYHPWFSWLNTGWAM